MSRDGMPLTLMPESPWSAKSPLVPRSVNMLKPEDYQRIVRARQSGMSMREISRRLGRSRESVRKILDDPIPRA